LPASHLPSSQASENFSNQNTVLNFKLQHDGAVARISPSSWLMWRKLVFQPRRMPLHRLRNVVLPVQTQQQRKQLPFGSAAKPSLYALSSHWKKLI
jgi:hypothetical protein